MKKILFLLPCLPLFLSAKAHSALEVTNNLDFDRMGEIATIPVALVREAVGTDEFRLVDSDGLEVPYQLTHDAMVAFPTTVPANSSILIEIQATAPSPVDTLACGAFYAVRKDDLAWENDKAAYRAYGPALQASGERAFGYDVWTKSVAHPVVTKRYHDALAKIASFHEDHGEGMDVYTVGPSLGAGTAALIDSNENIVFPWGFESYEILDNGPLRFSVRLDYPLTSFEGNDNVRESRVITLDAGEFLNRTEVRYDGLAMPASMAPGIVLHRQNPDGYLIDNISGVMAYADLTDNAEADNGVIYIGVVAPKAKSMVIAPMPSPEGDAVAHLLAKGKYVPETPYIYYWGSGWSKGFMPDWNQWIDYLMKFRERIGNPLVVNLVQTP